MSDTIQIDRFTRQGQSISGRIAPQALPRLADYLAADEGEIAFSLIGNLATDVAGSQKRRLKCIISGWILLTDPITMKPLRHALAIESRLVLVRDESELPPLELESEDEDYIVCGAKLDVMERVEEEILLNLPAAFGGQMGQSKTTTARTTAKATISGLTTGRISPFAKLAELKKK